MPRGKKAAQVELLPPEDDQQPRGRKRLVEAEHTIKYSAPVPVTVEDDQAEDGAEEDFELVEEEKAKRRRKTAKDERDDFRRELDRLGVASVSRLKLSIDKYRHSDSDDSGTLAEKDYCTKYPVTKEHILNDDYMDVARRYGAGRFWFTLRMDNKIVRQWERQVNQTITPSGPVIQNVNPADPNSPQVIVASDGQQAVMPSIKDIMKVQREALKEQLEMAKLMREAYGFAPEQPQQQQVTDPKIAALQLIAENPDVMEKIGSGIAKTVLGSKGGDDSDPWAEVAKEAIRSGQASEIVASLIREIMAPFRNMWGQNSGQTSPTQTQAQDATITPSTASTQHPPDSNALLSDGVQSVHSERTGGTGDGAPATTTEDQALQLLIDHCRRNAPVRVAYGRLMEYAGLLNEQYPQGSIDDYIDIFASMTVEAALEFVKTQPNGEAVVSLPHALEWTTELQRLIREAGQEGEDA